jgi:predicted RNase H-like nuclease (RuvC/YqgF family)
MNEDSINVLLKCKLCSKPFVNPVKTTDGRRGCRECISSDDENSQNLIPIEEKLLLELLDDLPVECIKCKQTNIRRGGLEQHNNTTCIKRICSCKAADLKCPWTGFYEQLNHHLESCSFELLRPILTEILNQNKQSNEQINQNRISLNEQQHEIEKLKQPLVSKSEHNIKYDDVQELREQCNRLQSEIQQLKTQNKQYENQILLLQQEFDDFKNHVHEQITHNNELEKLIQQNRPEFKQSDTQNEIQQIKQLQTEINQLSEHILKHDTEVLQLQTKDQNQRNEIIYIKQLCNQHDIQIKLLARKKCVIPSKSRKDIRLVFPHLRGV